MNQDSITSERIDELPMLVYWLKQMKVDVIIDNVLGAPHGNWEGLSYGELALVFIAYVVMNCTHFLSPVEGWVAQHLTSLSQALGKGVRVQDCTDDRLAVLLSQLGDEQTHPGEQIELELGQHLIRAYELPIKTARIDMTSISVHHQPQDGKGLMQFGHSKDHRPDLRQFKGVLGTLDPVGLPLATAVLSGEQADDPHYTPIWDRLVATIGHPDFLVVGDCKLASLENRAYIHDRDGFYLTPLPMTGNVQMELRTLVLNPPCSPQTIRLPGQQAHEPAVGQGFEVAVPCTWQNPDNQETTNWSERWLVLQSQAHAYRQRAGLQERLVKAETALAKLNLRPATERTELVSQAQTILKRYDLTDYLSLNFNEQVTCQTGYVGRGRPGPNRSIQTIETHTWTAEVLRQTAAIDLFNRLAGWRIYATNVSANQLTLDGAVHCYRQEWQPEHGFHRLKGGLLAIMPLYLRDDERIRGLLLLLGIALRVLTLTEFVARRDLAATGEKLAGLYAGNPMRATHQPTAERLLKAFDNITLYRILTDTEVRYAVTPLSPLQRRILKALGIPTSVYTSPPAVPLINSG
jgi:transposase